MCINGAQHLVIFDELLSAQRRFILLEKMQFPILG